METLNRFSGRLLTAFLKLAEHQQFKLAAKRMNVTPSAFSQMISRLEQQMGVRLFDRDTRHVSLTPEGELLVPAARALATDIESMIANLRDHAEKRQGKVSLAALPSLCADWLPRVIAAFRQRYPNIRVRLFDTVSAVNVDLLRRGLVDYAINSRVDNPEEFDSTFLFNEKFYFVCQPNHPLANRKNVKLIDLAGYPYIHSSLTGSIWHWIEPHAKGIEFKQTGLEVARLSTLAGLIFNGLGVSIVPAFGLFQFSRLGLCSVAIRDKGLHRPLFLVKQRGRTLSVAAEALLESIAAFPPTRELSASPKSPT